MKEKVEFDLDKHSWHPSPLIGQIVLVTTLNEDGSSNVAPKSWISMMAFDPPIVAFGCNLEHWTARNILKSRQYVINIPGAELVELVWKIHEYPHPRPVPAVGLTEIPALKVKPPRIAECKAHLECVFDQHLSYGKEVILLGRIVCASIDKVAETWPDPYQYLKLLVYLEDQTYGVIENAQQLG